MISTLETHFTGKHGTEVRTRLARNNRRFALEILDWFTHQPETVEPFAWIGEINFRTQAFKGKFNPTGREYMRDIVNDVINPDIREQSRCCATGTAKTTADIAQMLYLMRHDPFSGLYVMPSKEGPGGARQFNNGSILPTIRATEVFTPWIPADRHKMSGLHIDLGANNMDFAGANSATQLANKRCKYVWLGEQDKYKTKLGDEAGSDTLARERTTGVAGTKVFRGSTPSVEGRGIWPKLMESDLRRRFLPCPHCNPAAKPADDFKGWMVLVWSEQYTVLPRKTFRGVPIPFAQMRWDKEAKRTSGEWDRDRVFQSARFECPHCGGHVRDDNRVWMDKGGLWIPTRPSLEHRGYHLPSWYAPITTDKNGHQDIKATYGGMALKFLDASQSAQGMGGWINSDAAEVNANQEHASTIEISSKPVAHPDWVALLTADFHKNAPYIWFVIRKWCAFKLLPAFEIINGKPAFVEMLEYPGNETPKHNCETLVAGVPTAWPVLGELMRFDSQTGQSPLVDFLLAQKIVGQKLVKLFAESAKGDTMEFRRVIYELMARHSGDNDPIRPPRGGDSELIAAGNLETSGQRLWDDLRDLENEFKVGKGFSPDRRCVAIDCGYQEEFDAEVLQQCYDRAGHFKWFDPMSQKHAPSFHGLWQKGQPPAPSRHQACLPCPADGWLPLRGIPTNRPQGDGKISRDMSMRVADPFQGTPEAGTRVIEVLNVPQGLFWFTLQDLRNRRTKNLHTISPNVSLFPKSYNPDGSRSEESRFRIEDYQRQMSVQFYNEQSKKVEPRGGRGGSSSKRNPYHLDDCETYQPALAAHLELFETTTESK